MLCGIEVTSKTTQSTDDSDSSEGSVMSCDSYSDCEEDYYHDNYDEFPAISSPHYEMSTLLTEDGLPTIPEEPVGALTPLGPLTPQQHRLQEWGYSYCDPRLLSNLERYLKRDNTYIINLIEPRPTLLGYHLPAFDKSMVCQLRLRPQDASFSSSSMMNGNATFPWKSSSIYMARNRTTLLQAGSLTPRSMVSALSNQIQGLRESTLDVYAFGTGNLGKQMHPWRQLPTNRGSLRIQLTAWSGPKNPSRKQRRGKLLVGSEKVVCTPRALPTVADTFGQHDADCSLVEDAELRAFLDITENGNDTSALFPSFSMDSIQGCESNDGLDQEIEVLGESVYELNQELQGIKLSHVPERKLVKTIDSLGAKTSDDELFRELESIEVKEFVPCEFIDVKVTTSADDVSTVATPVDSFDDSANLDIVDRIDHDVQRSQTRTDVLIEAIDSGYEVDYKSTSTTATFSTTTGSRRRRRRKVRMPGTKGRRVRFAEVKEFFYEPEGAPVDNGIVEEDEENSYVTEEGEEEGGAQSRFWNRLEDALLSLDDVLDSLAFSCSGTAPTRESTEKMSNP